MIYYRNEYDVAQKAFQIPTTVATGYATGITMGQGLGLDMQSQKRLGTMSAVNMGLSSTSTFIDELRKRKEARDLAAYQASIDYDALPYDRYAYDYFSNTRYDGNYFEEGGIPDRYKNMGFNRVGQKKQSTRPGKKWMVLAEKDGSYKVVHGGDKKMQDYTQHRSENRRERFWDRMGGRNSAKAKDPFSPLYWHKRFGTWQDGGIPESADGLYEYPYQTVDVPSNRITMKDIPYDVYAYPNNDLPVLMKPGGEYYFPNSTKVREVPKYEDGGVIYDATGSALASSSDEIYDATPDMSYDYNNRMLTPTRFMINPMNDKVDNSNAPKGGTIAVSHNNPGNIKYGEFAKKYGATPGRNATDGGIFAVFPDIQTGLRARQDLMKGKNYRNLTVDQAMKRWSNNGYGGELYPEISNRQVSSLSDSELAELQRRQIKREDVNMYNLIYTQ